MSALKAWRLSKTRYAEAAFTGEGSRVLGGRWNSVGVPVVYASASLSLAVLEVFVHMTSIAGADDYVSVAVDIGIEESQAERVEAASLPGDWRQLDHPVLQRLGDDWMKSRRSLALLVPSVVVDGEWNVVINPLHPDARAIKVTGPKAFHFDTRMFRVRG